METRELFTNPLTIHLRKARGMTLKGWARVNLCSTGMTAHVVYHGYNEPNIVAKLRAQGLYAYLPEDTRQRIEESERAKAAKAEAVNGN